MQVNTNVYAIAKVNSQWMKEEDKTQVIFRLTWDLA